MNDVRSSYQPHEQRQIDSVAWARGPVAAAQGVEPNTVAAVQHRPRLGVGRASQVDRPAERERPFGEVDHDARDSPVRRIRGQEKAMTNRLQEQTILRGAPIAKAFEILPATLR